jgi:hypothetical protein
MNVSNMQSLIRADLNEGSTVRITDAEILTALNDGYKAVSTLAFAIEKEEDVVTVASHPLVAFSGFWVNCVELIAIGDLSGYEDSADDFWENDALEWVDAESTPQNIGIVRVSPKCVGYTKYRNAYPRHWFPWGKFLVIDPVPLVRYTLRLYESYYPSAGMALSTDTPDELPDEFKPCVVDFARYALTLKLKGWRRAAEFYNLYIRNLSIRKVAYIKNKVEGRAGHVQPDRVVYEGGGPWVH